MSIQLRIRPSDIAPAQVIHLVEDVPMTFGREVGVDQVFNLDRQMSARHLEIVSQGDQISFEDLRSTNGTFLNGARVQRGIAKHGDEIRIGQTVMEVLIQTPAIDSRKTTDSRAIATPLSVPQLIVTASTGEVKTLLPNGSISVGRTTKSDWCFSDDQCMSSLHFAIQNTDRDWEVIDLGSANGTQLNGKRITRNYLEDGDEVHAGTQIFRIKFGREVCSTDSPLTTLPEAPLVSDTISGTIETSSPLFSAQLAEPMRAAPNAPLFPFMPAPYLIVPLQGIGSSSVELAEDSAVVLGRDPECDVSIDDDPQVSFHHARIENSSNSIMLFDLGSSNGTYVNEKRVARATLQSGDILRLGSSHFRIQKSVTPKTNDTPRAPESPKTTRPPIVSESKQDVAPKILPAIGPIAEVVTDSGTNIDLKNYSKTNSSVNANDRLRAQLDDAAWQPQSVPTIPESPFPPHDAQNERAKSESSATDDSIPTPPIHPVTPEIVTPEIVAPQPLETRTAPTAPVATNKMAGIPVGTSNELVSGDLRNRDLLEFMLSLVEVVPGWLVVLDRDSSGKLQMDRPQLQIMAPDDASWMLRLSNDWGNKRTFAMFTQNPLMDVAEELEKFLAVSGSYSIVSELVESYRPRFSGSNGATKPFDALLCEGASAEEWRCCLGPNISRGFVERLK